MRRRTGGLGTISLSCRCASLDWPESSEGPPLIQSLHGVDDDTIPLAPTRDAVGYLKTLGANIELLEFEGVGHVMNAAMNEQFQRWLEDALRAQAPTLAKRPSDTSAELEEPGTRERCGE